MPVIVEIHGKPVRVTWSAAAEREMHRRDAVLLAEMELYFSCLIRKAVRFNQEAVNEGRMVVVNDHLQVSFRPVMTQSCSLDAAGKPPLETMPIVNPGAFVPSWLKIDFKRDQWHGEFGFGA